MIVKKIGDLDVKQLAIGLTGVAGLMAGLVASMKVLGSGSGTVVKGATQMLLFAGAIKILASVCTDLAELEWNGLAKGLTGVGVLLAEVSLFLNTAKFSGKSITTATGIVILSAAIKVLASACNDFGQMNWGEIGRGLTSIGALLVEVTAFTNLTGNAKHVISTGLALIGIAAAMKIFASAMSDFGSLGWEQIAKGLVAMGGALSEVAIAVNLMPKNMVGLGVGLIAVGGALEILANVLGKMGGMSWEQIAKGLVTLGVALAEMAIGLNLMNGTLGGSAAMLVAAGALAVLTPVLAVLGSMSWESIAKGLVTLAGAFTVIGVAGAVLIFGSNKRKLRKLLADINAWLEAVGLKLKGTWQVFRNSFTPLVAKAHEALPEKKQRHRRPRMPSALGYRFGRGYTILRKHNLFRLKQGLHTYYYRRDRNRVISFKRASGLISRLGQLRKCNSQKILERFYQPKTMFDLKKVVRRECRRLQALYPPYVAA